MNMFKLRKGRDIKERKLALMDQINRQKTRVLYMKWRDYDYYRHTPSRTTENKVAFCSPENTYHNLMEN